MRPGIPIVPILKQQRLSEPAAGKQRPPSAARLGGAPLSARREAPAADAGVAVPQSGTATPPLGGASLGCGVRPVPCPVLKQGQRKTRGSGCNSGRRTPTARAAHGGAGSTGGTGSSTAISGSCAPSLNDFWTGIDGLHTDLQMRADKMKTNGRSRFARLPSTPDSRTPEVPATPLDVMFPNTPESGFKEEASGSSVEVAHAPCQAAEEFASRIDAGEQLSASALDVGSARLGARGAIRPMSARVAWTTSSVADVQPEDSPQVSLCASSQGSRNSPRSTTGRVGGASGTGSSTSMARRRGQTPPGRQQARGYSGSRANASQFSARIRELEGELETTVASVTRRGPQSAQRRSGSAPPGIGRSARQGAAQHRDRASRQTPRATPHATPQATPRILCRDTLDASPTLIPTADASSLTSQPSRLWHICQMMQFERRELLETIQQVCDECGVQGSNAAVPESAASQSDQPSALDPRILLMELRDQHLALRARCVGAAESARPTGGRLSIQSDLSDLSGFNVAQSPRGGRHSAAGALESVSLSSSPFAAATVALQNLLVGVDERNAPDASALRDEDTRRDLAALVVSIRRVEHLLAPVLAMGPDSRNNNDDAVPRTPRGANAAVGSSANEDLSKAIEALKAEIGPGILVAILGEVHFGEEDSKRIVQAAAGELSAALGPGVQFITGGMSGVQECFARHCGDGAQVWNLLPAGQESGYGVGRDINIGGSIQYCKEILSQLADIYITVEGGPSVSEEVRTAHARGAHILPLRRTGWASAGMFGFPAEALQRPFFANEDQWELLGSKTAPVGSSVAALVGVVATFVNEHAANLPQAKVPIDPHWVPPVADIISEFERRTQHSQQSPQEFVKLDSAPSSASPYQRRVVNDKAFSDVMHDSRALPAEIATAPPMDRGSDMMASDALQTPNTSNRSRSQPQRAMAEESAADEETSTVPLHNGSLALSPSTAPATPWSTPDMPVSQAVASDVASASSPMESLPVEAPAPARLFEAAVGREGNAAADHNSGFVVAPSLWPTISPTSSCCSMPAVGRMCELIDEKTREVLELQARCDRASPGEEGIEAATLLAAAREELRLLREFAGVDCGAGTSSPALSEDGAPVMLSFGERVATPERRAAYLEETSNDSQEEMRDSSFPRAKHGLAHLAHFNHNE